MRFLRFRRRATRPRPEHVPGAARLEPPLKVRFSVDPQFMRKLRPPGERR